MHGGLICYLQADALHARRDETQRQLRACAPASRHTSAPTSNATPEQLRKRKAAAIEEYDAKIKRAKRAADEAPELRKLTPAELRARLAALSLPLPSQLSRSRQGPSRRHCRRRARRWPPSSAAPTSSCAGGALHP